MIATIQLEAPSIPLSFLCSHFGVGRSGFYGWQKREVPANYVRKQEICNAIRKIFADSRQTYGSPRAYEELKAPRFQVSENTVCEVDG